MKINVRNCLLTFSLLTSRPRSSDDVDGDVTLLFIGDVTVDDVTINDVFTRLQFAHFNRRPDISELVEEIICPRECDHMCIESNYGPVCACREGFRLYDDLRTCVLTEGKYLIKNFNN